MLHLLHLLEYVCSITLFSIIVKAGTFIICINVDSIGNNTLLGVQTEQKKLKSKWNKTMQENTVKIFPIKCF
jgi:hypothetical protein